MDSSMSLWEAVQNRHSVRRYSDTLIPPAVAHDLQKLLEQCNAESGLSIQMFLNEPDGFDSSLARYGSFKNVRNYFAIVGPKGPNLDELAGYYGEKLVLRAQQLGLNTCWVGLSYNKRKQRSIIKPGEKLVCLIALGYGETPGKSHRVKPIENLCSVSPTIDEIPTWFVTGMDAAQLAPTAINQQKFMITLLDAGSSDTPAVVEAKALFGPYAKVDLGIVKYHFEVGAQLSNPSPWKWAPASPQDQ